MVMRTMNPSKSFQHQLLPAADLSHSKFRAFRGWLSSDTAAASLCPGHQIIQHLEMPTLKAWAEQHPPRSCHTSAPCPQGEPTRQRPTSFNPSFLQVDSVLAVPWGSGLKFPVPSLRWCLAGRHEKEWCSWLGQLAHQLLGSKCFGTQPVWFTTFGVTGWHYKSWEHQLESSCWKDFMENLIHHMAKRCVVSFVSPDCASQVWNSMCNTSLSLYAWDWSAPARDRINDTPLHIWWPHVWQFNLAHGKACGKECHRDRESYSMNRI